MSYTDPYRIVMYLVFFVTIFPPVPHTHISYTKLTLKTLAFDSGVKWKIFLLSPYFMIKDVLTALTKVYIPPRPWRYRSLVNSAITVTNVWKTIQRYFIVHFQFEKMHVIFQSTSEKTKQWTLFPNNDRPAWYELIWEMFTNRHGVISQDTRNIFDRPLFTDDSVLESSKQSRTTDRCTTATPIGELEYLLLKL
jgi:hypothetical protein